MEKVGDGGAGVDISIKIEEGNDGDGCNSHYQLLVMQVDTGSEERGLW